MKTKNIAIIALISTLITSAPCSGAKDNPITSIVTNKLTYARDWTSNFINSCWNIGILATLYTKVGIYDFNKITGLNEKNLENNVYDSKTIEKAMKRVDMMANYGVASKKLDDFFDKLQKYSLIAQSKEQTADLNPE